MKARQQSSETRFFDQFRTWKEAEAAWDRRAREFAADLPLRGIKHWRSLPGIRAATRKNLRLKALYYLLRHDRNRVLRFFWRKPIRHFLNLLKSYRNGRPYSRDEDFFLYGFASLTEFRTRLESADTFLLLGFSYCHKPFECPSGRFTDRCIRDFSNPVCGQCFVGKCVHALPTDRARPLFIPTVHYIAEQTVKAIDEHPEYEVVFLITACELTLEMFGDWGNAIGVRGIGVRLDGQICNTMKAFEASENGIKPGMAVVLAPTRRRLLELLALRRQTKV